MASSIGYFVALLFPYVYVGSAFREGRLQFLFLIDTPPLRMFENIKVNVNEYKLKFINFQLIFLQVFLTF